MILSRFLLKQVLPFDDYDFFLCGPQPFMRTLYCGLLSLGMSESRIHYEFFGPGSMLTEEAKPAGAHGGRARTGDARPKRSLPAGPR